MTDKSWRIDIDFDEDDTHTHATARLQNGDSMTCSGHAYRNPKDQPEHSIGEEIAAARALIALGTDLLQRAAGHIEERTHTPAHLVG